MLLRYSIWSHIAFSGGKTSYWVSPASTFWWYSFVRNAELNSVIGLFECRHHVEDHFLVIVLLGSCEVQISRKPALRADEDFSQTCAALEGEPIQKRRFPRKAEGGTSTQLSPRS
jgi:hypothetical protein